MPRITQGARACGVQLVTLLVGSHPAEKKKKQLTGLYSNCSLYSSLKTFPKLIID